MAANDKYVPTLPFLEGFKFIIVDEVTVLQSIFLEHFRHPFGKVSDVLFVFAYVVRWQRNRVVIFEVVIEVRVYNVAHTPHIKDQDFVSVIHHCVEHEVSRTNLQRMLYITHLLGFNLLGKLFLELTEILIGMTKDKFFQLLR